MKCCSGESRPFGAELAELSIRLRQDTCRPLKVGESLPFLGESSSIIFQVLFVFAEELELAEASSQALCLLERVVVLLVASCS